MSKKIFSKQNSEYGKDNKLIGAYVPISLYHYITLFTIAHKASNTDLLLSLLLSLTALFWSLSYYQNKKNIYLVGIFVSLFLGILAKETALTFLGVIPLSILFFRKIDIKRLIVLLYVLMSLILVIPVSL